MTWEVTLVFILAGLTALVWCAVFIWAQIEIAKFHTRHHDIKRRLAALKDKP